MCVALLLARQKRLPHNAVFSGRTAGWLHGLDLPACHPIEVTLPSTSYTSRLARIALTRSDLVASEVACVQGLPVTSAVRTVADLVRRPPDVESVVVLDMALHCRLVGIEDLRFWAATHRGYRGIARLTRAIHLAEPAAESPMETRLRLLLTSSGLPRPSVQVSLRDANGFFIARPDLLYPTRRLVIEYDGAAHRTSLAADNRRQNRLIEAGYRVLRFTAGDILHTPAGVVALVRRSLFDRFAELPAAGLG